MKRFVIFLGLMFSPVLSFGQNAVVHINAEFNKSNDWYGLESLEGVKVYNGYIETNPAIKQRYNITKVPTLILYIDGEEKKRWEASLDMKLHVTTSEVQEQINKH